MNDKDLVSVITPAYNASKYIGDTIKSVQAQTYENWEMIIVNDCSTDDTAEIAREFASADPRIHVYDQKKNGGPARAWNRAFKEMHGRYAAFLDADDLWIPEKLERQLAFMKKKKAGFSYASYDWIDESGAPLGNIIKIPPKQDYKQMLANSVIGALTVIIDRELVDIKPIPPVQINDSMLWLSIAKRGVTAYGCSEILGHYRIVSSSFSRNKGSAAKGLWRLYRDQLKIPFIPRCWYFGRYALNSVKRYYLR